MNQYPVEFNLIDLVAVLAWATILILFGVYFNRKFSNPKLNKFFFPAWIFKSFMAFFFSFVYIYIQTGGGDTIAYWEGAKALNDLFFSDPSGFIEELLRFESGYHISSNFTSDTGMPPGWIYRELEAWNVSKMLSFLSIITFKSYFAATLILSSLAFFCSWMLTYLLYKTKLFGPKSIVFALLFFPSVAFWSSGISKDTFVYLFSILAIYCMFLLFLNKKVNVFNLILFLGIVLSLLFEIRPFMVLSLLIPFAMAYSIRVLNKLKNRSLFLFITRMIFMGLGVSLLYLMITSSYTEQMILQAQITQADFNNNPIYTGLKYDLDNSDLSLIGFISVFPKALFIGLFRPFLTESLNVNFIINGIESTILLLYFLFFVFNKNLFSNISIFRKNEFAMYSLIFVIILGFMAGYTSILFGVLVRIRSIALPFLFLILSIRKPKIQTTI